MALIEYKIVSIVDTPVGVDVTVRFYTGAMQMVDEESFDGTGRHVNSVLRFVRSSRVATRTRTAPPGTTRVQIENRIKALAADYPQHQLVAWQA